MTSPSETEPKPTEVSRIADQLRRVCQGEAWLGPSLKEVLAGIDELRARRRPIEGAHTIWEIVAHVTAWMRIARERLSATTTRDHTAEENWPAMNGSWEDVLARVERELHELEEAILAFPSERLDEVAPASEPQTFYILLHGVVQHIAYHAGQIALLRK
jgi:uncharacterized damage-inducible protein DinB